MRSLLFLLIVTGLTGVSRAEVPGEMLDRLPAEANALAVVDAAQLLACPLAQRESWAAAYADAYGSTPLLLPPDATSLVLAADLDLQSLQPRWETAVLAVTETRTAESIATKTRGVVDTIAGQPAVETPLGVYIVLLKPNRLGVFAPANRQVVARWLRQANQPSPVAMSAYLRRMTQQVQQARATIGVAIDLENTISARTARGELELSDVVRENKIPVDRAAQALANVQGLTLLVTARDRLEGTLTIDFSQDVAFLGPAAGPLVLELFRRLGASMDQWKDWQTTARGKTLTMTGPLAPKDLHNVFGLFRLSRSQPVNLANDKTEEPAAEPTDSAQPPAATGFRASEALTRRYFTTIASSVAELEQSMTGASPYQFALWLDNCTGRIEGLPRAGVDADVTQYGASVSKQLRGLLATLNALDQESVSQQTQVSGVQQTYGMLPTNRTINYGGYRMRQYVPFGFTRVDVPGVTRERQQIQQQALEQANSAAQKTLAQIQQETEATRKLLTQRYGGNF